MEIFAKMSIVFNPLNFWRNWLTYIIFWTGF